MSLATAHYLTVVAAEREEAPGDAIEERHEGTEHSSSAYAQILPGRRHGRRSPVTLVRMGTVSKKLVKKSKSKWAVADREVLFG